MAAAATNEASAPKPARPPTPDRRRFALTGPSRPLDHRTSAARRDLADVSLAGQWFAPHYAIPELWVCGPAGGNIRPAADLRGEKLGTLKARDQFAVLEIAGDWVWGFRETDRLVGYVDVGAFETRP